MTGIVILKIVAIGLPLIGALALALWRGDLPRRAREAVAGLLFGSGLAALALFILTGQPACMLRTGPQNCVLDGAATLLVFVASLVLGRAALRLRDDNVRADSISLLLLFTGWAGFGLADNLLQLLISIYVVLYSLSRIFRQHDIRSGIFVLWPDQNEEHRPGNRYDGRN
jgi:hypothetical protein